MAAQQLNVRVGLLFNEKSLANIERQMRSSGQRLSRIGTDLSLSLSLPLAAFGVTAIKSAGDIESLTLALKSQLGTAEAAAKELDLLTEAAKNPGLGVEQAVRGSVRLQGVGFAAEEARQVLIQMGNAIAATGGDAQELDNVTRQFAQITSKGRVLQEDVSVLSENMPGLAQLMQKAFGTANVEAIRNMGISGKEFVKQITKAAETLPRVEGGIKNGIGNAIDSLKQSAAKVGFAINEAFDVTGAIESVSGAVLALAQGFSSLDPFVKNVLLSLTGVAIAIGPVLKGFAAIKILNSQLVGGWGTLVGVGNSLVGTTDKMAGALSRVKLAFGIIGIVVGLAIAIDQLSDGFDAAEFASEKFAQAQKDIIAQTSKEIGAVNQLFAAVKDETKSKFDKGQSIDQLLKLYPDYFKGMDLEGASVSRLTELQNGLNSSILRGVAERKKAEAVNGIYEKQAEILTRITQIREGSQVSVSESALIDTGDMLRAGGIAQGVILKLEQQTKDLTAQIAITESQFDKTFGTVGKTIDPIIAKEYALRDAYMAEQEAHQMGIVLTKQDTKTRELSAEAIEKQKQKLKTLKSVLEDIANAAPKAALIGDDEIAAKIDALRKGIEKLVDAGFKPASKEVTDLKTQLDALTEKPQEIVIDIIQNGQPPTIPTSNQPNRPRQPPTVPVGETDEEKTLREAFEYAKEAGVSEKFLEIAENIGLGAIAIRSLSDGLVTMAEQSGPAFEGLASSLFGLQGAYTRTGAAALAAASQMVKAALASTLATAIQDSFKKSGNPLLGIALAGIAVAGVNALFGKIQQSLSKTPKFARGTKNAPGGVALVGEQGPELVNLPRGSQVFPTPKTNAMLSGLGGGGVSVSGEFTVKGTDLVLVLERTQHKNKRFR